MGDRKPKNLDERTTDPGRRGALRTLVTAAFSHRRKTLRNGLKGLLPVGDIDACGIDAQLRPEALAPEQFGRLALQYSRNRAADALALGALEARGARES